MTEYALQNGVPISLADMPRVQGGQYDKMAEEMLQRERDFLRRKLEYDSEAQLAWQNAQPIHTAFRLNGELVGTIGVNTGFTGTKISDGGAFQRAVAFAEQTGLSGAAFADYASEKVSQALKERYGASIEVEVFDPANRPTSGEMHAEMFGAPSAPAEPAGPDENELAWMKVFAQLYAQKFGQDPFAGLEVPFET